MVERVASSKRLHDMASGLLASIKKEADTGEGEEDESGEEDEDLAAADENNPNSEEILGRARVNSIGEDVSDFLKQNLLTLDGWLQKKSSHGVRLVRSRS